MLEFADVPELRDPVVIAAFEGWNDAAESASSAMDHLMQVWDARIVGTVDPEDFYDFQVNRPIVGTDDNGHRRLTWPSTQIAVASPPDLDRDIILVRGIEPNMRWRQFAAEVLAACDELGGHLVVTLGARDMIVVATERAVLVAPLGEGQRVKEAIDALLERRAKPTI